MADLNDPGFALDGAYWPLPSVGGVLERYGSHSTLLDQVISYVGGHLEPRATSSIAYPSGIPLISLLNVPIPPASHCQILTQITPAFPHRFGPNDCLGDVSATTPSIGPCKPPLISVLPPLIRI
ncbi:hypothetical protein Mmc1_2888 [Magnetococcus marinus MC-1]|uniref:Uncharacterized protein n=1 Tax=Magnetococcus marinus (strain ATCC BAA-1437 / JCM 17883 / MC-1) TaxID=156889 RepID=A0LBN6_MAGMM|nr:hypothetical protein [Magnetococcus marinus]ABK45379.1 hypothetical protein Mmc1_2888 [Magnetococcus marinus MC-1]